MEYVYSAMLLHKLGKPINESNVKHVIEAAGVKADENKVKALVAALEGVDMDSAIKEAAFAPAAAAPAEIKTEKKAEAKEEKKEEEISAGLGALFG